MSVSTGRFRRLRTVAAAAGAAALVVGVVGPAAQAQTATTGEGTSDLRVVPATLSIDGLPVDVDTAIGTLLASATNVDDPVARLSLEGLSAAGDLAPSLDYTTTDGDQTGTETRVVGVGGVTAAVNLVDWAVQSGSDNALAKLAALSGELTTPVGLGATIDAQQVSSAVTPTASGSTVTLHLTGVDLGLGDLLPADLLDALPLGTVLDLVDALGIPLSTDLASQVASVDQLRSTLEGAVAAAGDLAGAQSLLDAAIADDPTLSTLQDAVTSATADVADAQATVDDLQSQIDALESQIGALDPVTDLLQINSLQSQIDALTVQLTSAQSSLSTAQSALTAAQDALDAALADVAGLSPAIADLVSQVNDLTSQLETLLNQLDGLLGGLDLSQLRLDLLGALDSNSLLDLGDLGLVLNTVADATGGTGTATCAAEGLTVLGTTVPAPTCADIGAAVTGLGDTIADALSVLPVSAPVPAVALAGPTPSASGSTPPDANGLSTATAGITALQLGIEPVSLTATVDDLLAQLDELIGQLDAELAGLDVPVDAVTGALDLTGLETVTGAVEIPADLGDALGALRTTLDGLPLGDLLDGLSTLGLDTALGTVALNSSYSPTVAPATPASPTTPSSPTLPNTGSHDVTLFMAALAALLAGVVTRGLGRGFELGLHRVGTHRRR